MEGNEDWITSPVSMTFDDRKTVGGLAKWMFFDVQTSLSPQPRKASATHVESVPLQSNTLKFSCIFFLDISQLFYWIY